MKGTQSSNASRRLAVWEIAFTKRRRQNLIKVKTSNAERLQGFTLDSQDSVDGASTHLKDGLKPWFLESSDRFKNHLLDCLETNPGALKFYTKMLHELTGRWFKSQKDQQAVATSQFCKDLFDSLIFKAVQMNESMALSEVLSAAHDSRSLVNNRSLKNHPALIDVSENENRKLTKLFLSKEYYLQSTHFDKKAESTSWRVLPFCADEQKSDIKEMDEIQNLRILRAMSRPCYILDQFVVIYEKLRLSVENKDYAQSNTNNPCEGKNHCCALSDKFQPQFACSAHVECNDAIFRCFEMVKIADECARDIPEYREEYEEIGARCSKLAVELLENCKDTTEVETFLNDKVGAVKFFRLEIAKKLEYPRLQIAIQNNHRSFVGHMFCQQILRTKWHGNVPWLGKGFGFKLYYCFFQVLFTIPFVFSYLFYEITQGSRKGTNNQYSDRPNKRNLDEPLNRFISFTGMYLAFLALVILSVMCSVTDRDQLLNNFHWYHSCLFIFTIAMIINDCYILTSVRSVVKAFNFWRTYDLFMHMFLLMAFIARILMGKLHPCIDGECSFDVMRKRVPFDMFSNCALSLAAVMSGMRLFYWCQLNDRIGPIVINLSKVIMDLATFTVIILIMIMSFGIGIVSLKVKNLAVYPGRNSTTDNEPPQYDLYDFTVWDYIVAFLNTCVSLFWSSLNPEEPTEYYMDRMDGVFLHIVYGAYCVACVIVLLNLLIAIMNATIQKVSDSEHLYWKFVRTSIWIEFFGEENGLPLPFTPLLVALNLFKLLLNRFEQRRKNDSKDAGKAESNANFIKERKEVRRKSNKLLFELIQRYWQSRNDKDALWRQNESKDSRLKKQGENNHLSNRTRP